MPMIIHFPLNIKDVFQIKHQRLIENTCKRTSCRMLMVIGGFAPFALIIALVRAHRSRPVG